MQTVRSFGLICMGKMLLNPTHMQRKLNVNINIKIIPQLTIIITINALIVHMHTQIIANP